MDIINLDKFRKNKDIDLSDPEVERIWKFTGEIEDTIIEGLSKNLDSVSVAGILASRLGEMIRYVKQERGIDITKQILEMTEKYSK